MATGRAPWCNIGGDLLTAVHRIGYIDAVPEVPAWMSTDGKDFLARCFARNPRDRSTAEHLLEHPFLASAGCGVKAEKVAAEWLSPKSPLDAALWESDSDDSDDEGDGMSAGPRGARRTGCEAALRRGGDRRAVAVAGARWEAAYGARTSRRPAREAGYGPGAEEFSACGRLSTKLP
ncbi:hypothetical protein BAE44_0004828 [Dichanthelium oligosanthes]|uniref:Protein kinase domain-containing protein n=1 Tax=Dichanthelium oligosanthes TaxID=888268 RepID=A0A1E5W9S3_9POAL|nr:hypothetical protein BAE44_0004828 [Dichanthelium oligosanthes]